MLLLYNRPLQNHGHNNKMSKLNSRPFLGPRMCMLAAEFLFFCSIPTTLSGKALDGILPAHIFT